MKTVNIFFVVLVSIFVMMTIAFPAMKAKQYNFDIERGATFDPILAWEDSSGSRVNLTGCSAIMIIRPDYDLPAVITMNSSDNSHVFIQRDSIETSNVPSGSVTGSISLILTPNETYALPDRQYVFDLDVTFPTGQIWRLLYGNIFILQGGHQ